MHKNQYLIDICIIEGCAVLDDSCTECGTPEDWERAMTERLTGRELDAAVAERCFGLKLGFKRRYVSIPVGASSEIGAEIPDYSKDMAAAWQVAEWIREQTGYFSLTWWSGLNRWQCEYRPGDADGDFFVQGITAPEAICHAALRLAEQLEDT